MKKLSLTLIQKWKAYKLGWKEAIAAVSFATAVGVGIYVIASMLGGCAGTTIGVKYTHDSSIPDRYDRNESNMAGPYARFYACPRGRSLVYCPELEISMEWEFHKNYPAVYGTNPVGQIEIRQPIYVQH